MVSPKTSRDLATIGRTPLSQIYGEVRSPYAKEVFDNYLSNDGPREEDQWFIELCKKSADIRHKEQTDDEDVILKLLFEQATSEEVERIKTHLKEAPAGWIYEEFYQ